MNRDVDTISAFVRDLYFFSDNNSTAVSHALIDVAKIALSFEFEDLFGLLVNEARSFGSDLGSEDLEALAVDAFDRIVSEQSFESIEHVFDRLERMFVNFLAILFP